MLKLQEKDMLERAAEIKRLNDPWPCTFTVGLFLGILIGLLLGLALGSQGFHRQLASMAARRLLDRESADQEFVDTQKARYHGCCSTAAKKKKDDPENKKDDQCDDAEPTRDDYGRLVCSECKEAWIQHGSCSNPNAEDCKYVNKYNLNGRCNECNHTWVDTFAEFRCSTCSGGREIYNGSGGFSKFFGANGDGKDQCPDCGGLGLNLNVLNDAEELRRVFKKILRIKCGVIGPAALMWNENGFDIMSWLLYIVYDGGIQILKDIETVFTSNKGPWKQRPGSVASDIATLVGRLYDGKRAKGASECGLLRLWGMKSWAGNWKWVQQSFGVDGKLLAPVRKLITTLKVGRRKMEAQKGMSPHGVHSGVHIRDMLDTDRLDDDSSSE